ncbi:hypothetical protein Acr_07g0001330 [Actinidia rufa]|uniref:Uncharacterized protein n=1 Tax=Actinidia rufa TaxID=165716 RepID=A0A7J0EUN2_9ERIC|nr:hypothetical protein Acr_07g0001330 [Actinidia rufa]
MQALVGQALHNPNHYGMPLVTQSFAKSFSTDKGLHFGLKFIHSLVFYMHIHAAYVTQGSSC